ncbi:hypothetical protein mRhiFer1_009366 [Rhinolophus ferrumequinum]|uniref:Uncharacterized protein n=1 Tax=Rhinolophus ferrumequinum TaxID=59479 RepID=A0A7J7RPN4_RHIFE|nr:hypothetical protein mRhiFer1_009366 [Rhinolophus ferrumequinum]
MAGRPNGDVRHDVTQLLRPSTSKLSSSWEPLLPTSSRIHPTRHGFRPMVLQYHRSSYLLAHGGFSMPPVKQLEGSFKKMPPYFESSCSQPLLPTPSVEPSIKQPYPCIPQDFIYSFSEYLESACCASEKREENSSPSLQGT